MHDPTDVFLVGLEDLAHPTHSDYRNNDRRDEVPDFPLLQKRALVPPARLSCPAYRACLDRSKGVEIA